MLGRFRKRKPSLVPDASQSNIKKYYTFVPGELGSGSFSIVRACVNKSTNEKLAVKIINKDNVNGKKSEADMLQTEVEILKRVSHPNVIHMHECYEDDRHVYLVMELVTGGELFDRIVERGFYSEKCASKLMAQILDAVAYLHEHQIVHRDLKPENLLCKTKDPNSDVKIADFGLSKITTDNVTLHTACGTPGYVAPEVLKSPKEGYDYEVDIWSCGVILYILLCGFPPFYAENTHDLFDVIMAGRYDYPSPYWDDISPSAIDLINRMLVVNPKKRMNAREALAHPWIKEASAKDIEGINDRFHRFNAKRKFKRAGLAILAVSRMTSLVPHSA